MKKKLLMTAMVAALGGVGTAQAVHVNADGLGQVLIYPYYTVQNGFDTYINVVNTTDKVKAVKVRFLEGKNSQEVLDFNLYLSPKDEWAGAIVKTDDGAKLISSDTSCIAPTQIPAAGQAFRNYRYTADSVNSLARTREGYVEVIEMGEVSDSTLAAAATHVKGVPGNCDAIRAAAKTGGLFNGLTGGNGISIPTGGLYGFVSLINVNSGLKTTVDAVAIDNFTDTALGATYDLHTPPGDIIPTLSNVTTAADIIDGNAVVAYDTSRAFDVDNVSAILTRASIANDYAIDTARDSKTDWVITFPTKRFYVAVSTAPTAPFTQKWSTSTSSSCDEITLEYFDREERKHVVTVDEDFSPKPPTVVTKNLLCNEVNTLSIKPFGSTSSYATLFGAAFTSASFTVEDAGFQAGWLDVSFANQLPGIVGATPGILVGLPVVGFTALSNTNGTLTVGGVNVLSNYLGSSVHKGIRLFGAP